MQLVQMFLDTENRANTGLLFLFQLPHPALPPLLPSVRRAPQVFHTWQPWLDGDDDDNIFFASVQGYGPKMFGAGGRQHPLDTHLRCMSSSNGIANSS
jgi:hypothetical protein